MDQANPGWTSSVGGSTVTVRSDVKMDTQEIVEAFRRLSAGRVDIVGNLVGGFNSRSALGEVQRIGGLNHACAGNPVF